MPVVTRGQLNATTYTIRSSIASLADLTAVASNVRYHNTPSVGWGSVDDGNEDLLGRTNVGDVGTERPVVLAEELDDRSFRPNRFSGRLYFDALDKRLERSALPGDPASRFYRLEAVDVLISKTDEDDEFLVLASTKSDYQLKNYIRPAIRDLFLLLDQNSHQQPDSSPLRMSEGDFFRWLLYRKLWSPLLDSHLTLLNVYSMTAIDQYSRSSTFNDGADLDRPEILTLLARSATAFGPAKFKVEDALADLTLGLEMDRGGRFSVFRGSSSYSDESSMSEAEIGKKLIEDAAYRVIPDLIYAYNSDSDWRASGRQAFIDHSRAELLAVAYG